MGDGRQRRFRVGSAALALAGAAGAACSANPGPDVTEVATECAVSDLLVPVCGAWFGSSVPSADGRFDDVTGFAEYEAAAGSRPDIIHLYERGDRPFPDDLQRQLAERRGAPRSLLYFSWKPAPTLTWREVADGGADVTIDAAARRLAGYPYRLFVTIHHEPENDVVDVPGSGMTPADYVAMYRRVVDRLRAGGADNVVFVMTYMGFSRWASLVDALYPGDDVVDWIGYDPYGHETETSFARLLDRPNPQHAWPGFYTWATAKAPGKPIMLAEWGFDLTAQPDAPAILDGAVETLRSGFPMIKALVYWNGSDDRIEGRLGRRGELAEAFTAAFRRLAADPYFDATSTASAP